MLSCLNPFEAGQHKYVCLEADTKPEVAQNGDLLTEMDTGKTYMYDAENEEWGQFPPVG